MKETKKKKPMVREIKDRGERRRDERETEERENGGKKESNWFWGW
jgi:hypothetical protein